LVNHHAMSGIHIELRDRRPVTYAAPFKRAVVDREGVMRWKYWEGNEALKGEAVRVSLEDAGPFRKCDRELDLNAGIVLEGRVALPQLDNGSATLAFATGPRHYAVRVRTRCVVDTRTVDASGGDWVKLHSIDREWDFGRTAKLRILACAGMMEVYLDDHFMECWTMGCHGAPRVRPGLLRNGAGGSTVTDLKLWRMSLEPSKAPPFE